MTHSAAVLFARKDSIYKSFSCLDVFDIERDARTYNGSLPIIAHPPCRAWGQLKHMAKPRHDEKDLARFAVDLVRKNGGVLEHPNKSELWLDKQLPMAGIDSYGGWTLPISQYWFGHRAEKKTLLYIVGVSPGQVPDIPYVLGEAPCTIGKVRVSRRNGLTRPEVTKAEREHTPRVLAAWLVDLVNRVNK